ncbi:hypothetical protein DM02DRAFT_621241 [Periconia macrospinosa]|uniref:Uncharacterized protein n=1 Tax=Periconia macrospinosa TaxID=97972 RepID=A0A2V1ECS8_9PLEO|nr:hypothetical protein DM02DRAFT_621241 [Periconia macrospinosa]
MLMKNQTGNRSINVIGSAARPPSALDNPVLLPSTTIHLGKAPYINNNLSRHFQVVSSYTTQATPKQNDDNQPLAALSPAYGTQTLVLTLSNPAHSLVDNWLLSLEVVGNMQPPVAGTLLSLGPLIAPPYERYLPPVGIYYDPDDSRLKLQIPDGIEDPTIPDPYCGRCLKLRSNHQSSQRNIMTCCDVCGFCGILHLTGTICPQLYGTKAWYSQTQAYIAENPQSLHFRPSEQEERQLQRLSYIEPNAKYTPGHLPSFTRFGWALRGLPKEASVIAMRIHNPCIPKMSLEYERAAALNKSLPDLTSMKAEMAVLKQLSDGHKRIHEETQEQQKILRQKLHEASNEIKRLNERVYILESGQESYSNYQTNSKRRRLERNSSVQPLLHRRSTGVTTEMFPESIAENAGQEHESEAGIFGGGEVVGVDYDILNKMLFGSE